MCDGKFPHLEDFFVSINKKAFCDISYWEIPLAGRLLKCFIVIDIERQVDGHFIKANVH